MISLEKNFFVIFVSSFINSNQNKIRNGPRKFITQIRASSNLKK